MGINTRIKRSFLALGFIFAVAGTAAYMEFMNLNHKTQKITELGTQSIRLSSRAFDIAHKHNELFLDFSKHLDTSKLIQLSESEIAQLDSIMMIAFDSKVLTGAKENLALEARNYIRNIRTLYPNSKQLPNFDWYSTFQTDVYVPFIKAVKSYLLDSQEYLIIETTNTDANIHRSLMIAVVALAFMVIILFIFYKMLHIYYIRPVVRLTKSLDEYLVSKIPFVVKVDGKDEVYTLKSLILDLISQNKSLAKRDRDIFNS